MSCFIELFQSYDSTIAVIDWDEHTVKIGTDWNYSVTTGKYRNAFFKDMNFSDMATMQGMKKVVSEIEKNGFTLVQNALFDDALFTVTML